MRNTDSKLLRATPEGLEIVLKVTPKAKTNRIVGFTPQGLKVHVTAVPEKGNANEAVIALLAQRCRLAKGAVTLLSGETSHIKRILLKGDAAALLEILEQN